MADSTARDEKTVKPAPPAAEKGSSSADGQPKVEPLKMRRRLIWVAIWGFVAANLAMMARFFFPRTLFEPKTVFTIGTPSDFEMGVDSRFKQAFRIWVVRKPERLFVIYARCTHLGCTPNWMAGENKFKCPCHGSGYDSDGINFEGPAPRPMDRAHVELDPTGQVVVDTSKLYACPRDARCQFDDDGAYLVV